MKGIYEEIKKECYTSIKLRELAMDRHCDLKKAEELRKEQEKHYKKLQFLRGISKAANKRK